jgi:ribosome-associated protein
VAVTTLDEHKAEDIVVLDLREISDASDYFIIASGSSDTHVRALTEHVIEHLEHAGRKPHHVEGKTVGRWVLLDYVDFVVHIFHPTQREFYQLERLWADAPTV